MSKNSGNYPCENSENSHSFDLLCFFLFDYWWDFNKYIYLLTCYITYFEILFLKSFPAFLFGYYSFIYFI